MLKQQPKNNIQGWVTMINSSSPVPAVNIRNTLHISHCTNHNRYTLLQINEWTHMS